MDGEIAALEEKLGQLMGDQDSERRESDMLAAQIRQLEENIREATLAMKLLEEEYLIKQRTLQVRPAAPAARRPHVREAVRGPGRNYGTPVSGW